MNIRQVHQRCQRFRQWRLRGGRVAVLSGVLAVLLAPVSVAAADGCFVTGHVVTQVDADSAQVVWVSPPTVTSGALVLEPEGGGEDEARRFESRSSVPRFQRRGEDDLDYVRHLVSLDGLEANRAYRYRVLCDGDEGSRSGRFVTPPAADDDAEAFEFVVMSDTHNRHDSIAEAVAGDEPAFVVITGDLTGGRGHDWGAWLSFFDSARPYMESSVLWPVVGGHDVRPARNFRALFGFDDPDAEPADEDDAATYYSFRFGNLKLLALDHVYDREAQLEWVEQELARTEADWIIVALHDSVFTVGSRGSLLRGVYRDFAGTFERHGVDVVIFGHDHIYERALPLGAEGVKPVHYITTHAAGNFREPRPSPVVAGGMGRKAYMYAHFRIDGNTLAMEAREADGTVIDRLELVKDEQGMYQDSVMDAAVDKELALELAHIYTGQDLDADLRYERRDLEAEFASFPKADQPVEVTLEVERFPAGSELMIEEQADPAGWRVEEQTIRIDDDTASLEVTAPVELLHGEGTLDPPLELGANVRLDGRAFEPVTLRPGLGPQTRALLSPEQIPHHLGLEVRTYSDDLVPATCLDLPESPAFTGGFASRGAHVYYTWIEQPGDAVELSVTGGGIAQERYRRHGEFDLELYHPSRDAPVARVDPDAGRQVYLIEGERVASAAVGRTGEPTEVTVSSERRGMHLIHYDDNRDRTNLDWPAGMPMTVRLAADDNPSSHQNRRQRQSSDWDMVFYVPAGTESIDGHARASRGSIRDPGGDTVLELDGYQGYFSIPVDEAHQGALWKLRGYRGSELYFLNVPPYAARSAAELLLPREVVEADAP